MYVYAEAIGAGWSKSCLNPNSGFGYFANRCVNDEKTAMRKIRQIVRSARILRDLYA